MAWSGHERAFGRRPPKTVDFPAMVRFWALIASLVCFVIAFAVAHGAHLFLSAVEWTILGFIAWVAVEAERERRS